MPTPLQLPADFAQYPGVLVTTWTLSGQIYRFRFWPNSRSNDGKAAWYVDLYSVLGAPSVLATKLVLSDDLFGSFRTAVPQVPPGRVVVRRTDGVDADPRPPLRGEIGTRVATLGSPLLVVEYISPTEDNIT